TRVRDVGDDFAAIRQADLGDLTDSRIGLLRGAGHDLHAHATAERVARESRGLGLGAHLAAAFAHELVNGRHTSGGEWKLEKRGRRYQAPKARQELFGEK